METDDFTFGLKGFPIHLSGVFIPHIFQNIVTEGIDSKTRDFFGKAFSGVSITDDAHGSTREFPTSVALPIPLTRLNGGMSCFESVHQGQQHSQGVFSHRISIALGRIDQVNVPGGYGFNIYIFESCSHTTNEFEFFGLGQKSFVYGVFAPDDQPVVLI